jgi:hypothetical protein
MSTKTSSTKTKVSIWRNKALTGPARSLTLKPEDQIVNRGEKAHDSATGEELGWLIHIYRGKEHYYTLRKF